jgi:hypothetical protein
MISLMKLLKGGLRKKLLDFCMGRAHVPLIKNKKKMEMLSTLVWFCFILVFFFLRNYKGRHRMHNGDNFEMINTLKGYGQLT